MIKKYSVIFIFILGGIFLGTMVGGSQINKLLSTELPSKDVMKDKLIGKIRVGDKELNVEIVKDQASLKKGLSARDEIGSDGMLFILDGEQKIAFWMKDMRFSLDMIWIKDGKVIEISRDVPIPEGEDNKMLTLYSPKDAVDQVLEVNSGDSDKFNITVGDEVTLVE
ncbi:MAG: DUF192 domain-containing protein [Candidatus Pacebacteria bacterium]|nr:DUF192 domain-containing protein [Candidatus Paceibacterota bacterium]